MCLMPFRPIEQRWQPNDDSGKQNMLTWTRGEGGGQLLFPWGQILLYVQEKLRMQWPAHPDGSHSQMFVTHNQWVLFGATQ